MAETEKYSKELEGSIPRGWLNDYRSISLVYFIHDIASNSFSATFSGKDRSVVLLWLSKGQMPEIGSIGIDFESKRWLLGWVGWKVVRTIGSDRGEIPTSKPFIWIVLILRWNVFSMSFDSSIEAQPRLQKKHMKDRNARINN